MASFGPPIYRKKALEKLASPEELDRLMQITTPRSWLALLALASLLLIAILWGFFGKLTTTIEESGTLTLSNPIQIATAPGVGHVSDLLVKAGDSVNAGQVIARIAPTDPSAKVVDVTSPATGRVLAVRTESGALVNAGTPLLSLEAFDSKVQQIQVVAYLSLNEVQPIAAPMRVQISPVTAQRDEYGYLFGTVQTAAKIASTHEEMLAVLKDAQIVDDLISKGNVFEVRIALDTNPDGSYIWSIAHYPPYDLVSGTPSSIIITLKEERPISRVFPNFNR